MEKLPALSLVEGAGDHATTRAPMTQAAARCHAQLVLCDVNTTAVNALALLAKQGG